MLYKALVEFAKVGSTWKLPMSAADEAPKRVLCLVQWLTHTIFTCFLTGGVVRGVARGVVINCYMNHAYFHPSTKTKVRVGNNRPLKQKGRMGNNIPLVYKTTDRTDSIRASPHCCVIDTPF